jgi:hypothetical protein
LRCFRRRPDVSAFAQKPKCGRQSAPIGDCRDTTLVVGPREYHFGDYRRLELPLSLIERDRGSPDGVLLGRRIAPVE